MVREQTLSANEKKSYWRIFNGWSFINACSVILKELYARSSGIGGGGSMVRVCSTGGGALPVPEKKPTSVLGL